MTTSASGPSTGPLAAAISDAVVRLLREYTGRGPTQIRTTINENLVVSVLQDTLTTGERTLLAGGQTDLVLDVRRQHHRLMRADLLATIEALTGRHVSAFLSDSHIEPDIAIEVFILEAPTSAEGATPDPAALRVDRQ
jgi:uncharacterized protein YbcI